MFEIDLHEVEHKFGGNAGLNLKFVALKELRPILQKNNGIEEEDVLWLFDDSNDAVKAAIAMKQRLN